MAQLKDTIVAGSLRATDTIYSTINQFQILKIPTSSNGTTYSSGTNGQVLKSNGTSVYWATPDTVTDANVAQAAAITTTGNYPIILANSTATTEVIGSVNKTSTLTYNPNTKALTTGGTINGYTLAAAAEKNVDALINSSSSSTNLPTSAAVAAFVEGKGYTTNIGTITGITMNGASKGTSGIIDLGTVITQHQDISGKADLASTVTDVSYDSTNCKIKKTIGSTTSDVVEFSAGNNITLTPSSGKLIITATDTTYSNETAASNGTGLSLVTTGEKYNWNNKGEKMVILSYGKSTWQDFLNAYNNNIVVYCRASSNANPASGTQTRMAFMAYVNNATTPTKVEFQYYRSVATHSASQQGDQVYVYTLDSSQGWSVITREAYSKIATGTGLKSSYSNSTITLSTTSLHLTKTGISSLPYTISNTNIKNNMIVVGYSVTPNAGDLTITTANGSVTISGELITGKTIDITLDLME